MNQKINRVDEFVEERNIRILMSQMRLKKEEYISNRKLYFDDLERLFAIAFMQVRLFTDDENQYLNTLFKKYMDSLNQYYLFREKLSHYTKLVRELQVI